MKRKIFFLLSVLLATMVTVAFADVDPNASLVESKITALMKKYNVPGAAVVMVKNAKESAYYYGYVSNEKKYRVTRYTLFEVGSITKIFTSLLLAQELDYAKLSLADSIQKYLPNLPEDNFKNVSLLNLATHTSGLPFDFPSNIKAPVDIKVFLSEWKSPYKHNSEWVYSNIGMGLLGLALENETQMSIDDLYRRHILLPLNMQMIGTTVPEKLKHFLAQGYDANDNPVSPTRNSIYPAATGLKLSGTDMQKFLGACVIVPGTPERILYPMLMTQMAYVKLSDHQQGLGWDIYPLSFWTHGTDYSPKKIQEMIERPVYSPKVLLDKTGSTQGFKSYIAVIPYKKVGIAIMLNKSIPSEAVVSVGKEILNSVG